MFQLNIPQSWKVIHIFFFGILDESFDKAMGIYSFFLISGIFVILFISMLRT